MTPQTAPPDLVLGVSRGSPSPAALALRRSAQNVMFYFDPTQVAAGEAPQDQRFRLGGMVKKGSVQRAPGSLEVSFVVTDFRHEVPVTLHGSCRTCSARARAWWRTAASARGVFVADEVLAKHDEKYMPPEVARA